MELKQHKQNPDISPIIIIIIIIIISVILSEHIIHINPASGNQCVLVCGFMII